jgi:hypothetical protein
VIDMPVAPNGAVRRPMTRLLHGAKAHVGAAPYLPGCAGTRRSVVETIPEQTV